MTAMAKGKSRLDLAFSMLMDPCRSFVEFETAADLRTAVEKLDGREFKGVRVTCTPDVSSLLSFSA